MIRVLEVEQHHEGEFKGKPFPTELHGNRNARFIETDTMRPGFASCFMLPDENGNAKIVAANWDTSD